MYTDELLVVLVVQWFGVGLVIERSLDPRPGHYQVNCQLSLPSIRGR